jgi:hypothetical protein
MTRQNAALDAALESSQSSGSSGAGQDPLAQASRETAERTGQLADRARETGLQQANTQKERVADTIQTAAGAIRRVGDEMGEQQPALHTVAQTAAEKADQLSAYLRDTDAREILRAAEDFARRQPLLVVGGAFVLGLLGARFLKASSTRAQGNVLTTDGRGQLSGGYGATYPRGYETGYTSPRSAQGI